MTVPLFKGKPTRTSTCIDQRTWGIPSLDTFSYPTKATTGEVEALYPTPYGACPPYLHYWMRLQRLLVDLDIETGTKIIAGGAITAGGTITAGGVVTAPSFKGNINVQSWKGFDIKHPNKDNHRLRHICLEGPEAGVYFRGRLTGSNIINLPDYWEGLVDPESITVTLTQIKYSQDLIVDSIEWGKRVVVKSGNSSSIDCYYTIHASRIDGDPLVVEYKGETPREYPGDSSQYSISGYDYDVRGTDYV